MLNAAKSFLQEEDGATLIEYALLAALVAVACIAGLSTLATAITGSFTKIDTKLGQAIT